MALVSLSARPSLPLASPFGDIDVALKDFTDSLSPELKSRFEASGPVPDAHAVLVFTGELDDACARRNRQCISSRATAFLESVQSFATVVDTFVSSHPEVASLIWGSVKLTLRAIVNASTYFEKTTELLMEIRGICPRCVEFSYVLRDSWRLQRALCDYYAVVVRLCQKIVGIDQTDSAWTQLAAFWKPFETEFGPIKSELKQKYKAVESEVFLASEQAHHRERQLMHDFRLRNANMEQQLLDMQRQRRRRKIEKLLNRLTRHNHKTVFKQALKSRVGETCDWPENKTHFRQWRETERGVLWLHGKMGCGKTVTTAHLINKFQLQNPPPLLAYFFCNFQRPESLLPEHILGSLIRQLLDPENMSLRLEQLLTDMNGGEHVDEDIFVSLLENAVGHHEVVFVIDGVEQCAKRDIEVVLSVLQSAVSSDRVQVKLLVSSNAHLAHDISKAFPQHLSAYPSDAELEAGIAKYVAFIIHQKSSEGALRISNPNVLDGICKRLVEGAEGVFLWVALQMEYVCQQVSDHDAQAALRNMPKTLKELYEWIMKQILEGPDFHLANHQLRWISAALRPLTIYELHEAIVIEDTQRRSPSDKWINDHVKALSYCKAFVYLDEEEMTVQFAHLSIRDFLHTLTRLDGALMDPRSDYYGRRCLTYLHYVDLPVRSKAIATRNELPVVHPTNDFNGLQARIFSSLANSTNSHSVKYASTGLNIAAFFKKCASSLRPTTLASERLETEENKFAFLEYAREFWLLHLRGVSSSRGIHPAVGVYVPNDYTKSWKQFKNLIFNDSQNARFPWTSGWTFAMPHVQDWIVNHRHYWLTRLIADAASNDNDLPRSLREIAPSVLFGLARKALLIGNDSFLNTIISFKGLTVQQSQHLLAIQLAMDDETPWGKGRVPGFSLLYEASGYSSSLRLIHDRPGETPEENLLYFAESTRDSALLQYLAALRPAGLENRISKAMAQLEPVGLGNDRGSVTHH